MQSCKNAHLGILHSCLWVANQISLVCKFVMYVAQRLYSVFIKLGLSSVGHQPVQDVERTGRCCSRQHAVCG